MTPDPDQPILPATSLLRDLLAAARAAEPRLLDRLRTLVEMESPSHDKHAVDRVTTVVARWCTEAGATVTLHRNPLGGDTLEAHFPSSNSSADSAARPILLLGHLDTVWDIGTLAAMPWRQDETHISGPGVLDMKAGVVMALAALELLSRRNLPACPVVLLLHGDEEIGSPFSRPLTERVATRCRAVYVLEPAQGPQGAYKTARKGVGNYRLHVRGVASHAGVDFDRGHSAILELGRQLEVLAALSDPARGLTVNPGVIGGGTRSNVVAAEAWVEIDVRVTSAADAEWVDRRLHALEPADPACTLTLNGALNRPPMVRTPSITGLFARAKTAAAAMGLDPLTEASTGGGSDGNFTAALGVPTLDGMGAIGGGAHAADEHVLTASLAPRTALLAAMLLEGELTEHSLHS